MSWGKNNPYTKKNLFCRCMIFFHQKIDYKGTIKDIAGKRSLKWLLSYIPKITMPINSLISQVFKKSNFLFRIK
jgi:hypothetical protein